MKISPIMAVVGALMCLCLPACQTHPEQSEAGQHKIVVTSPKVKDVDITEPYVCQIRSKRHIEIRPMQGGYLEEIQIKEGQWVEEGELMFKIKPILYKAKRDAELAEAHLAELELQYTEKLASEKVVSINEVALYKAKLTKANARAKLAQAELDFTEFRAPFPGIVDRLYEMQGSLIKERDVLSTLSDNSEMWVYFNVPEARYHEYINSSEQVKKEQRIELVLANGKKFPHPSTKLTVESEFNNATGNIPFRADFPNPDRKLRHGMTGTILLHRPLKNAIVIPQRATFEILDKQYVYVVDKDNVVHPRAIEIQNELEDIFVIKKGLAADDRIVYEGVQQVHDKLKLEDIEFRTPDQVLAHQKYPAE